MQKIECYKKAAKKVKSENVAMKFQSVVHRSMYASLKEKVSQLQSQPHDVIIDNMHRFEKIIQDQTDEIMALRRELDNKSKEVETEKQNKTSIQEKYAYLMKTHQNLEKDWNSQLSVICNMEKGSLQEIDVSNVKNVDRVSLYVEFLEIAQI